ncbi:MAG: hypothetical protein ABI047_06135 [Jatrophihabitantaceae bacterium]
MTVWLLTEVAGVPTMNSWPTRWAWDMLASALLAAALAVVRFAVVRLAASDGPGCAQVSVASTQRPPTAASRARTVLKASFSAGSDNGMRFSPG